MSYLHIPNLYSDQRILAFRRCYALEKVHGTSARVGWAKGVLRRSHESAVLGVDLESLSAAFTTLGAEKMTVFGEAYGGKEQGMGATYGSEFRFIAFEVQIDGHWLAVPQAADVAAKLGLEFVPWVEGPTDLEWLDAQRDADSEVAIRRGMGPGKTREGVVLRPPFEVRLNNDERVIAKHKGDDFRETRTPRPVDPAKLMVLQDAESIALEWVTPMRLQHVLQRIPEPHGIEQTGDVCRAMIEDVAREGAMETVMSREATKAIGTAVAKLYKAHLRKVIA